MTIYSKTTFLSVCGLINLNILPLNIILCDGFKGVCKKSKLLGHSLFNLHIVIRPSLKQSDFLSQNKNYFSKTY